MEKMSDRPAPIFVKGKTAFVGDDDQPDVVPVTLPVSVSVTADGTTEQGEERREEKEVDEQDDDDEEEEEDREDEEEAAMRTGKGWRIR